ncbi:hypothetical protein M5K25_007380 [Dendrobium thyrsiflorum]|uniref:DUF4005 domain-containing protein n=1 Tax=Dendrobium thyrsiflorum TaxID=117978 RepID=A0ABD0VE82_DENTH
MAKSKGSCFRIMSCACRDSASSDELLLLESKASSDKSRWSFRKRLSGPRVLSKNAILEPESGDYNKDSVEAIPSSFNSAMNVCVSEKTSIKKNPSEEEFLVGPAQSFTAVNSKVSAIVARNSAGNDENIQEFAAIIIQAAIRGHLGVRKLIEVKYAIKLQAAVRGHLVRAHAIGTLRCIRAITKMQAIVRARLASPLHEKVVGIADKKLERNRNSLYLLGKYNCCEGTKSSYSTKKLLHNRFAQKMLVSAPNTRPIYIKCDPSKSDAVWKWLERWMTIVSSHTEEENDEIFNHADKEAGKSPKLVGNEEKKNDSANSKSGPSELVVTSDCKGDLNASSESNLGIRSSDCLSGSCVSSVEKDEECDTEIREVYKQSDSFSSHILAQSALTPQRPDGYPSHKNESKGNNLNNPSKKEQQHGPSEIEAQKFAIRSRRPCNPAFSAAHSKFEELTSNSQKVKCISSFSSAYQDPAADARVGNYHSQVNMYKEPDLTEDLPSRDPIIQVAASECGTEISISSTLDSPDRSETECGEIILEIGSIDKHNYDDANTCSDNIFILANKGAESQASESNKLEEALIYAPPSSRALDMALSAQQQKEPVVSEVHGHLEAANFQQDATSVEGTPRSNAAALEPYGTPSSEISVNAGSRSKDGNTPSQRQRLIGPGRKLVSRATSDSTARHSTEHLSNGSKNEKMKKSTAVSRTDLDDEPRMSNSNSSSLPSYMQATKSARAKVHANNSPKSSPDLHEKDNHIKKRHSFPIVNGKQASSPPKQRLTPRPPQNAKSDGIHAPHTSAERRWQR